MIYTNKIKDAVAFSIKVHELDEPQKRKGKDIPYITHPLTVGLILARAGASEDVIVAGILHDTVEDSVVGKKVTKEMLSKRFGATVAKLVMSVTETDKTLSWDERKEQALEHIGHFSHDSVLVKSADIISNTSELIDDYAQDGETVFERFNAPKEKILEHALRAITAIIERWSDNPLKDDLHEVEMALTKIMEKKDFKAIYKDRAAADAFADELVKAMVDNLNRKVKEENSTQ